MNFTCSRKDLEEALDSVSRILPSKSPTPIITGVYMKAENSMLEIQANNFELGIMIKIPVNTEVPGEIVVTGKYLLDIIKKVSGSTVSISYNDSEHIASIKSDTANFKLLCMAVEDFPKIKQPESFAHFVLKTKTIKQLIQKTSYSCATDSDSKPIFTGCCLRTENNSVTMSATNTHRIAVMKEECNGEFENLSLIIPSKTVIELSRMLEHSDPSNDVSIDCSNKSICFTFENAYVVSRLIDGEFPPYDRVIPKSSDTIATVKVSDIKSPVERIALIAKETEYKNIQFIFSQNGINISAYSPDIGNAEENVNAIVEGPDLTISFNYNYITDVLKVLESDEFVMKLTKSLNPVDIREKGNDNFIYIITPVRTY